MHEMMSISEPKLRKELAPDEMLQVIFKYAAKISGEKDLDKLLMLMADMGRELIVSDRCTVWLYDQEKDTLWTKVAHGVDRIEMPSTSGLAGHTVHTGESIIIEDAYNDKRFNQNVDKQTGYRTKAMLVIPFRNHEEEIIGCYQAINKMTSIGIFSEQDLKNLEMAATYAGKSLESAFLQYEIEETQKEIIYTMGEIGESRSKETGNHVKRVAEYSRILADGLGMKREETELIKMASPMHDIGKVAIPDDILKKPGKLTDEEFEIMKSHASIGYNLLKNSKRHILKAASIIANEHHEKWNGRGYPNGKKGEEIHIYGRITAIADVFDALASDRCYKKAWELDRILNLFKEERNEHFDGKLVDVFFDKLDELLKVRDTYKDV
ncbi:HD domain-containing phosphohydrolase [Calidifontibacillus oryziterrae]|uniref:HD domain-containing phosphohydrolase n=1 Tax=Calidifontibacillus oryziterrae TaxID=1191699 RepID=UPI000307B275|nr:HD domain-containing phosphohydrolase [Calidifontibacillus oryziterrae]